MPEPGTGSPMIEPTYLTVADVARLTDRHEDVIRRYIRENLIDSVPDPRNRHRRLIPDMELATIWRQPKHGYETRSVKLSKSDGSTINVRVLMRKKEA